MASATTVLTPRSTGNLEGDFEPRADGLAHRGPDEEAAAREVADRSAVLHAVAPERDRPLHGRARLFAGHDLEEAAGSSPKNASGSSGSGSVASAPARRAGVLGAGRRRRATMGVRAKAGSALRTRQRSSPVMPARCPR